jgi:mono/diheme cytochrome c family protein
VALGVVVTVAALVLAACGGGGRTGGSSPYPEGRQAEDRQLAAGRRVYVASCARCHGVSGQGNVGPRLAGRVSDRFPDIEDQISFVENGKGLMPSFSDVLTDEEIRAVVRYEREVL